MRAFSPLFVAVLGTSCTPPSGIEAPKVRSAAAGDSALAFEVVRADWDRGDYGERASAVRSLARFRAVHQRDPLLPVAWGYLALEALEHDDMVAALPYVLRLANEPLGSTQQLYTAALARIARLEHRERDAFALTSPVVRSAVEPVARNVMLEEHARAALAARPMPEALDALDLWLNEGLVSDRRRAEALVDALLADQAGDALARAYAALSPKERRAKYSLRLLSIVQGRLEGNELLAELEQSVRSQPRIRGHVLGVVVQTSNDLERLHAAEFLRGISWGMDHAISGQPADTTLYVKEVSEKRSDVCAARSELERAGVSLVALGPDGHLESAWSTCTGRAMPVLVGAQPSQVSTSNDAHDGLMQDYSLRFRVAVTPLAVRGNEFGMLVGRLLHPRPWVDSTDPARVAEHDQELVRALGTLRP